MARTVFRCWGVRSTDDFGRIVFELVERGEMSGRRQIGLRRRGEDAAQSTGEAGRCCCCRTRWRGTRFFWLMHTVPGTPSHRDFVSTFPQWSSKRDQFSVWNLFAVASVVGE